MFGMCRRLARSELTIQLRWTSELDLSSGPEPWLVVPAGGAGTGRREPGGATGYWSGTESGLITRESAGDGWSGTGKVRRLVDERQILKVRDRRLAGLPRGRQQTQVRNNMGRTWPDKR